MHIDQKVFFTALGFLAVILNDTPKDKQALRAAAIAGLIEAFCMSTVPEAFGDDVENVSDIRDRMVAAIAVISKADGKCQPHELENQGFTPNEISRHWPMAYALACASLNIKPVDS